MTVVPRVHGVPCPPKNNRTQAVITADSQDTLFQGPRLASGLEVNAGDLVDGLLPNH
jgi:hypothetical protein